MGYDVRLAGIFEHWRQVHIVCEWTFLSQGRCQLKGVSNDKECDCRYNRQGKPSDTVSLVVKITMDIETHHTSKSMISRGTRHLLPLCRP
jgi:hypothetical protein